MSLKKRTLNGLTILSLTLMASTAGWCSDDERETTDTKPTGSTSLVTSSDFLKTCKDLVTASGRDTQVQLNLAGFGYFSPTFWEDAFHVFQTRPLSVPGAIGQLAIGLLKDDAFRTGAGMMTKRQTFQTALFLVNNKVEEMVAVNRQITGKDKAITEPEMVEDYAKSLRSLFSEKSIGEKSPETQLKLANAVEKLQQYIVDMGPEKATALFKQNEILLQEIVVKDRIIVCGFVLILGEDGNPKTIIEMKGMGWRVGDVKMGLELTKEEADKARDYLRSSDATVSDEQRQERRRKEQEQLRQKDEMR